MEVFIFNIFFQHGYLTYYSTDLPENLYVYCLDVYGGKGGLNYFI